MIPLYWNGHHIYCFGAVLLVMLDALWLGPDVTHMPVWIFLP
jgi:hypothetical protein